MILPLEQQVAYVGLCLRLKELSVPQECMFYWTEGKDLYEFSGAISTDWAIGRKKHPSSVSAFTVAELGVMLPPWVSSAKNNFGDPNRWYCADVDGHTQKPPTFRKLIEADTEADARAKMLIHLIETGLLYFPNLPTRL